jgi:hypothetical protein
MFQSLLSFLGMNFIWFVLILGVLSYGLKKVNVSAEKQMCVILVAGLVFTAGLYGTTKITGVSEIKDHFENDNCTVKISGPPPFPDYKLSDGFQVSPWKKNCGACALNRGERQPDNCPGCCNSGFNGSPRTPFEYLNLSDGSWQNPSLCNAPN